MSINSLITMKNVLVSGLVWGATLVNGHVTNHQAIEKQDRQEAHDMCYINQPHDCTLLNEIIRFDLFKGVKINGQQINPSPSIQPAPQQPNPASPTGGLATGNTQPAI